MADGSALLMDQAPPQRLSAAGWRLAATAIVAVAAVGAVAGTAVLVRGSAEQAMIGDEVLTAAVPPTANVVSDPPRREMLLLAEARHARAIGADATALRELAARIKEAGASPDLVRERGMLLRLASTDEADFDGLAAAVSLLETTLPEQTGASAAATENELGLAKRLLGQVRSDAALLSSSVDHYRRAMTSLEDLDDMEAAATVRWNLAIALRLSGEKSANGDALRESASLFRRIIEAGGETLDRTAADKNLGLALLAAGESGNDVAALREAASAFQASLTPDQSGRTPVDVAETRNGLANALEALGEREWDLNSLTEALDARRKAAEAYRAAGLDSYQFYFDTRIAWLEGLIEQRRTQPIVPEATTENQP